MTGRDHRREVEFQTKTISPYVMPMLEAGEGWHAMPVADGLLTDFAAELNDEECVDVLVHAARGLDAAHQLGLVHRDVSPGNILKLGGNWVVSDFGLVSRPRGLTSAERTQGGLGTRGYRAPDVDVLGAHEVDARADIYGLGRVMRFVLGGRPDADVPQAWRELLGRMTATSREQRPASLKQVLGVEAELRERIRHSRRERWLALRDGAPSAAERGLPDAAVEVFRLVYEMEDISFFRHSDVRAAAATRLSGVRLNLGWQELVDREFVAGFNDEDNARAWNVTDAGKSWAREHAAHLERGARIEPPAELIPRSGADAPF